MFDHLGPGIPPQATTAPAALRLVSLAALPIGGTLGWLLVVAAARRRGGPPIDRTFVDTRILTRAPEEIAFWLEDKRPVVADVLSRLAGEAAISIHADRPAGHTFEEVDEHVPVRLHMRRVAADASLTAFERDILDDVFGDARELTTESHRQRHAGRDYDPDEALQARLRSARQGKGGAAPGSAKAAGRRWTLSRVGLTLVFAVRPGQRLPLRRPAGRHRADPCPLGVPHHRARERLADRLVVARTPGARSPRPAGRAVRAAADAAADPEPAAAGGRVGGIGDRGAGRLLPHARAFPPALGDGGVLADLVRMRAYAQAELGRPRPQLDDRWIPRLRALGLGGAIDAWRARHSGAAAMPPEHGDRPLDHDRAFHRDVAGAVGRPEGVGGLAHGLRRRTRTRTRTTTSEDHDDEADGDDHAAADAGTGRDEDRS